jgi:hypothetical protein
MIFCDIVDQSENCIDQNNDKIESIVSMALRHGGQVFINGQLVVFETSKSSVTTVSLSGQNANSATSIKQGISLLFAVFLGGIMFV